MRKRVMSLFHDDLAFSEQAVFYITQVSHFSYAESTTHLTCLIQSWASTYRLASPVAHWCAPNGFASGDGIGDRSNALSGQYFSLSSQDYSVLIVFVVLFLLCYNSSLPSSPWALLCSCPALSIIVMQRKFTRRSRSELQSGCVLSVYDVPGPDIDGPEASLRRIYDYALYKSRIFTLYSSKVSLLCPVHTTLGHL